MPAQFAALPVLSCSQVLRSYVARYLCYFNAPDSVDVCRDYLPLAALGAFAYSSFFHSWLFRLPFLERVTVREMPLYSLFDILAAFMTLFRYGSHVCQTWQGITG